MINRIIGLKIVANSFINLARTLNMTWRITGGNKAIFLIDNPINLFWFLHLQSYRLIICKNIHLIIIIIHLPKLFTLLVIEYIL